MFHNLKALTHNDLFIMFKHGECSKALLDASPSAQLCGGLRSYCIIFWARIPLIWKGDFGQMLRVSFLQEECPKFQFAKVAEDFSFI